MREFELVIEEALKKGLSPDQNIPFNSQWLYDCLGFRVGRQGLEAYKNLTKPFPSIFNIFYSWPYPQVLVGDSYSILIMRDSITNQEDLVYTISADHQTLTHLFSIDELTFGKGSLMEIADFGEYFVMVNGVITIVYNPTLTAWVPSLATSTFPLMKTICNFKGQLFGGGLKSPWYDCDETFYIWSKIGSADFTIDQDNEAGYRRCPFGGNIYHVRRLGDAIIGYSSKGITLINPTQSTYGFKELDNIGLINQGAMNGDLNQQIYVGEDYILRRISSKGLEELGYQHLMEQLISNDIIVSYDPSNKDFYISDGVKTFLFSQYGMTRVGQNPSTVWRKNNQTYILPSTLSVEKPFICSEVFDMSYRGHKTVFVVESDAFSISEPEAGIDYTNNSTIFTNDIYKPINNQGIASNTVSGNNFRFRIRFSSINEDFKISYIKVRYKMTDLRGIRGVYAPPIRGQKG
jgi:hypothetical protein